MPDDVIIGDRISFANQINLRNVSNLRCSWEISRIGLMSFDVPLRDLPTALRPVHRHIGKWITYKHPDAGPWGGRIASISIRNSIVTFDCESWASCLRAVLTIGVSNLEAIAALGQAIAMVQPLTGIAYGGTTLPNAAETADYYTAGGFTITADVIGNGQDIYDTFIQNIMSVLLQQWAWAASLRGLAWNITAGEDITRPTPVFAMDFTYGNNLSTTVHIQDGLHCVDSGWTDDLDDVYNWVNFTALYNSPYDETIAGPVITWHEQGDCLRKNKKKTKCIEFQDIVRTKPGPTSTVPHDNYIPRTVDSQNEDSVTAYGRRAIVISRSQQYPNSTALDNAARAMAADLSRNEQLILIELNNEPAGAMWRSFREGDIVDVQLGNNERNGNMLIRSRAYDSTRGTMLISGEANLNQ